MSMKTRVKICGLTRPEDVALSIQTGAAFLGFIVEAPSKRRLSVKHAAQLSLPAKGIIPRVAVTVNANNALLRRIKRDMRPDYIQCHGEETPERLAEILRDFSLKTIKAIAVSTDADMKTAEHYSGAAEFILYDAKPPTGSKIRGGHGLQIDWGIVRRAPLPKLFALAGGLDPANVATAIKHTGAPIVDVSSGVEITAGVKDPLKIEAFMNAALERS